MNINDAIKMIQHCQKGIITAGRYFDAPYTQGQLIDAAVAILAAANLDGASREELTVANRRYAAVNAQLAKLRKKYAIKDEELES